MHWFHSKLILGISQALVDEVRMSLWDMTLSDLTHPERGHTIRIRKVVDGTKIRYRDVQISPTPTRSPIGGGAQNCRAWTTISGCSPTGSSNTSLRDGSTRGTSLVSATRRSGAFWCGQCT
jgi:hypothetical protein